MKLELKEFQETYVGKLLAEAGHARGEIATGGNPQSLVLASPTGSGKTVIATAFIERVIAGDDDHDPDPAATFLWLSYQPDLNEQTKRKIETTSSVLTAADLTVIGTDFDQERFAPGRVHFLNAQKLGQDKRLVTAGDSRAHTVWETVRNTANAAPGSFYVIIDEAHKGMQATGGAGPETIMQKFLLGSPGEIPPADLVLGISATPQRFQALLEGAGAAISRNLRPVVVDPDQVRASGLLKDRVTLFHPDDAGEAADHTLLEQAAKHLKRFATEWKRYSEAEDQPPVRPILVVQVEDARGGKTTATDLGAALHAIEKAGKLTEIEVAHAFQEGAPIEVDGRTIRYIAPADIQDDPDLRAVFFKQSLNTGWDCPRAEVMMSFRRARDRTHIAQLIGRMVRTPLARRIETTEFLNSVCLYLPRFDKEAVGEVVAYLTSPDSDHTLIIDALPGSETVEAKRIDEPELVAAYEDLPSYTVPRAKPWTERRRLLKLGRALSQDGIEPDADAKAVSHVVEALIAEWDTRKGTSAFKDAVKKKRELVLSSIDVGFGIGDPQSSGSAALPLTHESVSAVFAAAGKKLGNGLHLGFLGRRSESESNGVSDEIKLELAALLEEAKVLPAVEAAAKSDAQARLSACGARIRDLPPDRREEYAEIQRKARDPELIGLVLPTAIQVRKGSPSRKKHLFRVGTGGFPGKLNRWESLVTDAEIADQDVVGWLRNVDRKDWAVCVPYDYEGTTRALYPDLIIFRRIVGEIVIDILDPHREDLDDAWAKAKGLADYADKHSDRFGRIQVISVTTKDSIRRIDLADEDWRKKTLKVSSTAHLKALYEQAGE